MTQRFPAIYPIFGNVQTAPDPAGVTVGGLYQICKQAGWIVRSLLTVDGKARDLYVSSLWCQLTRREA